MFKDNSPDINTSYNYRRLHESFMQNHNGTTIWENILIITPAPVVVYFVCLIKFSLLHMKKPVIVKRTLVFTMEFILIVCFFILNVTLLCNFIHITVVLLIIAYFLIMQFSLKNATKELLIVSRKRVEPRPYFTYFRSIVSLLSCICILAVDFHIFPRRYAKTENFGYGLMDTGVGFYIVANGIVLKQHNNKNLIRKSLLSTLPVLTLGIIRYFSLFALDYQQHITEYGIHWNFFFTLAFVKLFGGLMMHVFPSRVVLMAIVTGVLHQILLFAVTENWVLGNSSRSNFLSANREGLVSLPGYITLYFCSVAIGKSLNLMPVVRIVDDIRHGLNAFIYSIIFLIITLICHSIFDVSRRLANLTYITWIITMSLFGLSLSIFSEIALRLSLPVKKDNNELLVPNIFQAINFNCLLFFLISNILTGVVNLKFQTFYANQAFSVFILIFYKLCSCIIMHLLYVSKIKFKFW